MKVAFILVLSLMSGCAWFAEHPKVVEDLVQDAEHIGLEIVEDVEEIVQDSVSHPEAVQTP